MPKQIHKVDEFHGGENNHADPRDILNNELAVATDVAVNELGKIRLLGGNEEGSLPQPDASSKTTGLQPGYGLFKFSHDMDGADASADIAVSQTDYLALADTRTNSDSVIDISADGGAFSNGATAGAGVQFSEAVSGKADMYYVDGALRVNDVDFGASSFPTWYGYIGELANDKFMMSESSNSVKIPKLFYDVPSKPEKPNKVSFNSQEAVGLATNTYTKNDVGTRTATGAATYTTGLTAALINDGSTGVDHINAVKVTIRVDVLAEAAFYFAPEYSYSLIVRQVGGGFSQEVANRSGSGADTNVHYFSYQTPVDNDTNWEIVLNPDVYSASIEGIVVQSAEFIKSAESYADHTQKLAEDKHQFHVSLAQKSTAVAGAFGWAEDWELGMSLIYDGHQESLIKPGFNAVVSSQTSWNYSSGSSGTEKPPGVAIYCQYGKTSGDPTLTDWNKRITGAVVYLKRLKDKHWYSQYELDFEKGVGKNTFSNVERAATTATINSEKFWIFQFEPEDALEPQLAITYESRTGISHEEKSISSMWKASCVANRRAYIGNLKVFYEDGTSKLMNDKMVRSLPNKFDIFPISESVDVAINDGESIIALVEFNDRILQFKEKTLYVINASQDMEFLEDKLDYRGVSHKASVFKTEYGIVWANNNGCFYYDGRKVNDLLQKDGRPLINQTTWETFLGTYPLVGYSPKKKQVIVVDDISNNGSADGSCYIFDMITRSWIKGDAGTFIARAKSNFIIDTNGDLIHAVGANTNDAVGDTELVKWDDTAKNSSPTITTKDIDFGSPSQKKSIKKVYISYTSGSSVPTATYGINGDTTPTTDFSSGSFATSQGKWTTATFVPASDAKSCNSFQIKISGSSHASFEINDISIVYRPKSIK
jgi:hypothetical protein